MKKYAKGEMGVGGTIALGLLGIGALTFVGTAYNYGMFKFWAPKFENVKRQVFENTYSYKRGTIQDLRDYQQAWITGDSVHKQGLKPMIIGAADQIPQDELPPDLAQFVVSVRDYPTITGSN